MPTFQVTPFARHLLGDAEPVEDLQRALGIADAARALADAVGVVEKHHRHAALREIDRGAEADRAGADDDDRVVRVAPVLVGRAAIRELAESAALVHAIRLVMGAKGRSAPARNAGRSGMRRKPRLRYVSPLPPFSQN